MLFPTLQKKLWGCFFFFFLENQFFLIFLENQFFLISRFMLFSTLKKYWKVPLHLLVKWEVISPNSREGQLESISSIPLFWFCISNVGWGGGGVMLYAISNISRKKYLGIQNNDFSFNVFFLVFLYAGNIVQCPFTYSYWLNGRWFLQIINIGNFIIELEILPLHLLVKWEVVSPNRRYTCREF